MPFVKNGQCGEMWNEDGAQATIEIPGSNGQSVVSVVARRDGLLISVEVDGPCDNWQCELLHGNGRITKSTDKKAIITLL